MKRIGWFGALLALLGILGLAIPVFTTSETKDIVKMGDLKIQNTEQTMHVVPLPLSAGLLVLGIIFMGEGLYQRTVELSDAKCAR
jgi:hypothetical protein